MWRHLHRQCDERNRHLNEQFGKLDTRARFESGLDYDSQRPSRREAGVRARTAMDDALLEVPPPIYVEALTGREVGRNGKILCPLYDERTPSFHAYPDPDRGWYCFGCDRGGTIYDLAAALWGARTRGDAFGPLRREIAAALLGREVA